MAAVVYQTGLFPSTAGGATYVCPAFTPPADALLVLAVGTTGDNSVKPESVTSNTGLTFTKVGEATQAGSIKRVSVWVADAASAAVSTTLTYTATGAAFTGGTLSAFAVTGWGGRFGAGAARQSGGAAAATNQPATITLPVGAALTDNPLVASWSGDNGGAVFTFSPDWTTHNAGTHSSPTSRYQSSSKDSGLTTSTIAVASYNAARAVFAVELDASSAGPVGSVTHQEGLDELTATAAVTTPPLNADVAIQELKDVLTSSIKVAVVVNTAQQQSLDVLTSTATVAWPARVVNTAHQQDLDVLTSTATVVWPARVSNTAVQEGADALTTAVTVSRNASAAIQEGADALTSTVTTVFADISASAPIQEGADTLGSTASVALPLIETFTENFEGDTSKWGVFTTGGTVTFTDGTSVQTITSAVEGNQATIISQGHYKFTESSLFLRFVQPIRLPGDVVGIQTGMGVRTPTGGRTIQWVLDTDGILQAVKQDNFVLTVIATVEPAYYANPLPYAWLRVHEKAGVTYWDSAPITASNPPIEADWVNRASVATNTIAGDWTDTQVNIYAYMHTALSVPTQPLKVDGVNTAANAAPGGVSASVAIQEGADALDSTATVAFPGINASAPIQEGADSLTSTVVTTARASVAVQESNDALTSTVVTTARASATIQESNDALTSTVTTTARASVAVQEANDALTSTVTTTARASVAIQEAPDSLSSTVAVPAVATLAVQEAADVLTATASALFGIVTNVNVTEDNDVLTSTASLSGLANINASVAIQEANDSLSSTATIAWAGLNASVAVQEANDVLTSTVTVSKNASVAISEAGDTLAATVGAGVGVVAPIAEAADALSSTASVISGVVARVDIQEGNDTLTATAKATAGASVAVQQLLDVLTATVSVTFPPRVANVAIQEGADSTLTYTVKPRKRAILIT